MKPISLLLALPIIGHAASANEYKSKRSLQPVSFPEDPSQVRHRPPLKNGPPQPDFVPRDNLTFVEHEYLLVSRYDCTHEAELFGLRDIEQARATMLDFCDRFMVPGRTRLLGASKNGEVAYYVCNYSKKPVGCSRREFAQAEDRWLDRMCGVMGAGYIHMPKWMKMYGRAYTDTDVCPGGTKMVNVMFRGQFGVTDNGDANWCGLDDEELQNPNFGRGSVSKGKGCKQIPSENHALAAGQGATGAVDEMAALGTETVERQTTSSLAFEGDGMPVISVSVEEDATSTRPQATASPSAINDAPTMNQTITPASAKGNSTSTREMIMSSASVRDEATPTAQQTIIASDKVSVTSTIGQTTDPASARHNVMPTRRLATIWATVAGNVTPTRGGKVFGSMETVPGRNDTEFPASSTTSELRITHTRGHKDVQALDSDTPIPFEVFSKTSRPTAEEDLPEKDEGTND